ncbi:hypothetical protein Pcinc_005961 [Petrolisthes cinctipes]|uniref:C3H1-type domain-containing protein n=1 Tax=Petrolisthes cinctipes TaxID=88211 RepID=A0AAE1KYH7_PETCI|nr:hypothetical protein Pcinc_005961 [Petrolisthes cinctipes]
MPLRNTNVSRPICRFYKRGVCKYGISGRGCKFDHPKPCQRLIQHGPRGNQGCKSGQKCQKYHPMLCRGESASTKNAHTLTSMALNHNNLTNQHKINRCLGPQTMPKKMLQDISRNIAKMKLPVMETPSLGQLF